MARKIKKSVINKKIKKIENEIKILQRIIKKRRGDEKNKARSEKVKIYKKIIKAHNQAKKSGYTKKINTKIADYNKKIKQIKTYKPRVKKTNSGFKKPSIDELCDKYWQLLHETNKLNKGINRALQYAGVHAIIDIDDMLNIDGLSWPEIVDIIELFYNDDIEELFYENPDDPDRVFDGEYFKTSLKVMIEDIRKNKETFESIMYKEKQ